MKFFLGLVAGMLVVVFIVQNLEIVDITFLFWTLSISRALMVFLVFIIGLVLGALIRSVKGHRPAVEPKPKPEPPVE